MILVYSILYVVTQVVALPGGLCPPGPLHAHGGRSFSAELLGHCQPSPGQPHSLQSDWDRYWSGHWFYPGQLSLTAETEPAHLVNILSRRQQTWSTSPSGWQSQEDWSFSLQSFTSSMIGSVSLRTSTQVSPPPDGDCYSLLFIFQPSRTCPSSASSSTCWRRSPGRSWGSSGYSEPSRLRTRTAATTATPTGWVISKRGIIDLKYGIFFSSLSLRWSYWMVWWMFGFVLKSVSSSTGLSSRRNKTWQFTQQNCVVYWIWILKTFQIVWKDCLLRVKIEISRFNPTDLGVSILLSIMDASENPVRGEQVTIGQIIRWEFF